MNCPTCGGTATHLILDTSRAIQGMLCRECRECWPVIPIPADSPPVVVPKLGPPLVVPVGARTAILEAAHLRIELDAANGWLPVCLVLVQPGDDGRTLLRFPESVSSGTIHDLLACALPSLRGKVGE